MVCVSMRGYNAILSLDGTHMHVCIYRKSKLKTKLKKKNNAGTMREKCIAHKHPSHLDLIKKYIFAINECGISMQPGDGMTNDVEC